MPTNADPVYLDSSALVKMVIQEKESSALSRYLRARSRRVSCGLARVELIRAVRPHGSGALARARALLEHMELLPLDDSVLDDAAALTDAALRSLDAIHLAAARTLRSELAALVTYDRRLAAAAAALELEVASPA